MSLKQKFKEVDDEQRSAIKNAKCIEHGIAEMLHLMNMKFDALAEFLDEKDE